MYYTLSQLRDAINQKIVEQGESAPVAAFIFTGNDVVTKDDDCNEVTYPDGVVQEVLIGVGDSDYIYSQVLEQIDDEIKEVLKQTATLSWTNKMKLNKAQFEQLVENYVSQIVEGLDVESLESMVTDLLIREYETYTEEQIVGEVTEIYGEEFTTELLESATDVTLWELAQGIL